MVVGFRFSVVGFRFSVVGFRFSVVGFRLLVFSFRWWRGGAGGWRGGLGGLGWLRVSGFGVVGHTEAGGAGGSVAGVGVLMVLVEGVVDPGGGFGRAGAVGRFRVEGITSSPGFWQGFDLIPEVQMGKRGGSSHPLSTPDFPTEFEQQPWPPAKSAK